MRKSFLVCSRRSWLTAFLAVCTWGGHSAGAQAQAPDPLPSWNDGPTKQAIVEFVERVTEEGGSDFVPVEQRIATFDNDGTLWAEQPIDFQFAVGRCSCAGRCRSCRGRSYCRRCRDRRAP